MKIAFVYFWGPWAGGIERFLIRLSGWLADKGIEVDLVLAKAEGELLPEVPTTVQVKDLGAEPILLTSKLRIGHHSPQSPSWQGIYGKTNQRSFWRSLLLTSLPYGHEYWQKCQCL